MADIDTFIDSADSTSAFISAGVHSYQSAHTSDTSAHSREWCAL